MTRVKLVYWGLLSVLGALTVFLLAAAARLLRSRAGGPDVGEGPGPPPGRPRRPGRVAP